MEIEEQKSVVVGEPVVSGRLPVEEEPSATSEEQQPKVPSTGSVKAPGKENRPKVVTTSDKVKDVTAVPVSKLSKHNLAKTLDIKFYHPPAGSGGTDHSCAGEQRACARCLAIRKAADLCTSYPVGKRPTMVLAYPSNAEEKYKAKLDSKELPVTLYRDAQMGWDLLKNLRTFTPKKSKYGFVLVLCDTYPTNDQLGKLFHQFKAQVKGTKSFELRVVYAARPLGGLLGVDSTKGLTAVWLRSEDDSGNAFVETCAVQSHGKEMRLAATCYRDFNEPWWMSMHSGFMVNGVYFQNKGETLVGRATFLGILYMTDVPQISSRRILGAPDTRGVLIRKNGLMPDLLRPLEAWTFNDQPNTNAAEKRWCGTILDQKYGKLMPLLWENDVARSHLLNGITVTLNYLHGIPIPAINKPVLSRANEQTFLSAKARTSVPIVGGVVAALSVKSPLVVTIERVIRELYELFKAAWEKVKSVFSRDGSKDCHPQNVLINGASVLRKLGDWLSQGKNKNLRKLGQKIGYLGNKLSRPAFEDPIVSLSDLLLELTRWCMVIGSVVFERLVSKYTALAKFLVVAIDALLVFISSGSITSATKNSLSNLAINFLLALLPLWVSLPIHLIYDTLETGLLLRIFTVMNYLRIKKDEFKGWLRAKEALDEFADGCLEVEDCNLQRNDVARLVAAQNQPFALDPLYNDLVQCQVRGAPPIFQFLEGKTHVTIRELHSLISYYNPDINYEARIGAIPLIDQAEFKDVGLTLNSAETFLAALATRYSKKPEELIDVAKVFGARRHFFHAVLTEPDYIESRAHLMEKFPNPRVWDFTPYSESEFREHIKSFPRSKRDLYLDLLEAHKAGLAAPPKDVSMAPASGKRKELLRAKHKEGFLEVYVKGRQVMYFRPRDHFVGDPPLIMVALGFKRYLFGLYNSLRIDKGGFVFTFFTPKKSTPDELTARLQLIEPNEILFYFSGDDGHVMAYRMQGAGGRMDSVSCDAKSCEFTILKTNQREMGRDFMKLGLPEAVWQRVIQANSAPSVYKIKNLSKQDSGCTIVQDNGTTNKSGQAFTTIVTTHAVFRNYIAAIQLWDEDFYSFPRCIRESNRAVGMEMEFEVNDRQGDDGAVWARAGMDSFLAHVPCERNGRWEYIPLSYTKTVLLKGVNTVLKGQDFVRGIAARSFIPSLQSTPRGQAIRQAFLRYLHNRTIGGQAIDAEKEFLEWRERDFTSKYKLSMACLANPLTVEEEITFLSRFGVTPEDYAIELACWGSVTDFPAAGSFPVSGKMASVHYGYEHRGDDFLSL